MSLFSGYEKAHGLYAKELTPVDGGIKLKGKAYSINSPVTTELWEKHIAGEQGLGIIPINEQSLVKFAAIDIDQYPLSLEELNMQVQKFQLPLVTCRTKSGGAHLYLFLRDWSDAARVVRRMREFAAVLGHGNAEIFPKQTKIIPERGDIGQWINMPYFEAGNSKRYALDMNGKILSSSEFIEYAGTRVVSEQELHAVIIHGGNILEGGPPCLNHLVSMGFPEGTRNNGLFNLGIYARKRFPDTWQGMVEHYNKEFMNPPLPTSDVLGVIKSLNKKEFGYMCKQVPIVNYCNMAKCRQCPFGIGTNGTGMPRLGTLTKLMTQPPVWFIEVEGGGRLELQTEDLQNQRRFQAKCMSTLNVMPAQMKGHEWEELLRGLLENVTITEMPAESTPAGQLRLHLEEFCTGRVQARIMDEIVQGKPWLNNGMHVFRLRDFLEYLERRKFKLVDFQHVAMHLHEWGAEKVFHNIKGRGIRCYAVRQFESQQDKFDPPAIFGKTPF